VDRGGQWLFTLKANRPVQHAEVGAWFADPDNQPGGEFTTTDADNGRRIEVRRHVVSHDIAWMLSDRRHPDEAPMPGLAMIGMVEATTIRRFYLSSVAMEAPVFAAIVRAHWRIESVLQKHTERSSP
jgi:hypothetical protein